MDHSHRPLSTPGTARRALPFGIAALLSFGSLVAPPGVDRPSRLLVPLAIATVIVLLAWRVPWRRLPAWTEALPPLACFLVIGLVRHDAGGSLSGVAATAMLPVFWLAL